MIRFACDKCNKTADNELPKGWSAVQSNLNKPSGETEITIYHLCDEHGMNSLLGRT